MCVEFWSEADQLAYDGGCEHKKGARKPEADRECRDDVLVRVKQPRQCTGDQREDREPRADIHYEYNSLSIVCGADACGFSKLTDRRDSTGRLTLENDLTGMRWINSVISHQLVEFSIVNVCFHTR